MFTIVIFKNMWSASVGFRPQTVVPPWALLGDFRPQALWFRPPPLIISKPATVNSYNSLIYTHTRLTALSPGLPGWAGTREAKPIWILLKQQTVTGSGISWAICMSAPRSRQITMPAPHHSVFYRPNAIPAVQPTASKH